MRSRSPLPRRWHELCHAAGADEDAAIDAALADLVTRHGEPQRRYHTLEHVAEVLQTIRALADPRDPGATFGLDAAADHQAVSFAAWFHDAVYDPTAPAGRNEAASADHASGVLARLGVDRALADEVARLVLLTAGHTVPKLDDGREDDNGMLLVDADLAILAARRSRYERYADAIRVEYGHVDDESYRAGRTGVLETFLARGSIYSTRLMLQRCDEPARENLRWELARLAAPT